MGGGGYLLPSLFDPILVVIAISLLRVVERGPDSGPMISCASCLADFQQMPFSEGAEHRLLWVAVGGWKLKRGVLTTLLERFGHGTSRPGHLVRPFCMPILPNHEGS